MAPERTSRRRAKALAFIAILALAGGCGPVDSGAHLAAHGTPESSVPRGPLPRAAIPQRYRLALSVDPDRESFSGHVEIDITLNQERRRLYLHGLGLAVHRVVARLESGQSIAATYREVDPSGVALLSFAETLPRGPATLVFDYSAPFGHSLFGLYKVMDGGLAYAFTQFEPIRARRAFPSFDEPGFKTPFAVTIIAPKADKVVSNTPLAAQAPAPGGMARSTFAPTLPLPTYLIAFNVGPFDVVDGGVIAPNAVRSWPLQLRGIATKGKGEQMRYTLALAHKIVAALETYFAIPFPFQKLDLTAVPDFASGAMENAGAISFRQQLLLVAPTAPLEQRRASLSVVSHEITHQWFGDLVTPKWWDDLWLNESFARWMQSKVAQQVLPDEDFSRATLGSNLHVMDLDELPSARRVRQPVKDSNDIENAFDRITYDKGAAILAMFEKHVGPDVFRAGIRAYLRKYARGNASARDFIAEIAAAAHDPRLVAAFETFLDQPGIPLVELAGDCVGNAGTLQIESHMYAQLGREVPRRHWDVPLCTAAGGETTCSLLTRATTLSTVCPATLMPNAHGTGYYRFQVPPAHWAALVGSNPALDAADQLALFHNLNAAVHAGKASPVLLLTAMRNFAPNASWDLLVDMKDALHQWRAKLLAQGDLPAYRRFVATVFGPRLKTLGIDPKPGEAPATALTRLALLQLTVEEAGDTVITAKLAAEAKTYLTTGKGPSSDTLQEAMRAAVLHDGMTFAAPLLKTFVASKDEYFRRSIIYALAGSNDPAVLEMLLALILSPDMRVGEIGYVYTGMQGEPVGRAVLWHWFGENYTRLLGRLSPAGMQRTPGIAGEACDVAARDELDAFFRPKIAQLPGTPRTLALAEEQIDRCIAFRAAKGEEIRAALQAAR